MTHYTIQTDGASFKNLIWPEVIATLSAKFGTDLVFVDAGFRCKITEATEDLVTAPCIAVQPHHADGFKRVATVIPDSF